MNNIVQLEKNQATDFSQSQIDLLKKTLCKDLSDDELSLFLSYCKNTALDPFSRQIYCIKNRDGKISILTSIDGFRLIAERSEKYEGQSAPQWCGADGIWKDVWISQDLPKAARVGVFKNKFREPLYAVALFDEYAQRYSFDDRGGRFKKGDLSGNWAKMPVLMISKVAEALALRKAFPNDIRNIYTDDEMSQVEYEYEDRKKNEEIAQKAKENLISQQDNFVFRWGVYNGKKFEDVMPEDFDAELAKYEAQENKTERLQKIIDIMKEFKEKKEPLFPDEQSEVLPEKKPNKIQELAGEMVFDCWVDFKNTALKDIPREDLEKKIESFAGKTNISDQWLTFLSNAKIYLGMKV